MMIKTTKQGIINVALKVMNGEHTHPVIEVTIPKGGKGKWFYKNKDSLSYTMKFQFKKQGVTWTRKEIEDWVNDEIQEQEEYGG